MSGNQDIVVILLYVIVLIIIAIYVPADIWRVFLVGAIGLVVGVAVGRGITQWRRRGSP